MAEDKKKKEEKKEKEEEKEEDKKEEKEEKDEKDKDEEDEKEKKEEKDDDKEEDSDDEVEIDDERFESIISTIEELNVVELAELVKAIEKKFGVSAAAAAPAAGGGAGGGKSSFDVVVKDPGGKKIQVIKAVKEITGKGLKEAKELVDGAPAAIKEGVDEDEANELKEKLEEAGATVELE